jgi:allantoinase
VTGFDLVLRSRRVMLPDGERAAAVCVTGGRIEAIESYEAVPGQDLDDAVLLPGLVDTHVHVNEPGRTEWEGFATATRAAAAGGVTTIVDMPLNSVPPTVDVRSLDLKRAAASRQSYVDVGFWGGAVPGNRAELVPLYEAGVFGFKCFLVDSGVPEFPPLDADGLAAALRTVAAVDGLLNVHAEDPTQVTAMAGGRYADFLVSRPPVAENAAIATVIEAARQSGARVHILHLSSASALPLIAAARQHGVRITAETCPHYLALAAEDVPDGATQYKCCPPIRDKANRDALWHGLTGGVIDCVVSDHSPCPPALKRFDSGDFGAAWGGIASLQLGLAVVWSAARSRGHTLSDVVGWMAKAPARLAGLRHKGRIAVGYDADLVAFAPDEPFVVDPVRLHHRHPVTPYAGSRLTGVVRATWLRGEPVDGTRGEPVDGTPRGRLLSRGEA